MMLSYFFCSHVPDSKYVIKLQKQQIVEKIQRNYFLSSVIWGNVNRSYIAKMKTLTTYVYESFSTQYGWLVISCILKIIVVVYSSSISLQVEFYNLKFASKVLQRLFIENLWTIYVVNYHKLFRYVCE